MKKIYNRPEMLITEIELSRMIAVSRIDDETADPNGEVLSRENESWGSRRRNDWDDEEDEMDGF